jgi:PAS domain S-box-containing protein
MLSLLYVDDDDALLELFQRVFEASGEIRVDTALSGPEALRKIEANHYDAVVSDYQMPGMTGIELVRRLRRAKNKIPFVIYTHQGMVDVAIEALNEGVDFFVLKDINLAAQRVDIAHKIRQAVRLRRAERSLAEAERQAHIGNWTYDFETRTIEWSEEMYRLFDLPPDALQPDYDALVGLFEPEDRIEFETVIQSLEKGTPVTWVGRTRASDGSVRHLRTIMTVRNDNGENTGSIFGTTQDITNLKQAEGWALQYAEDLFRRNQELDRLQEELRETNRWLDKTVEERTREVDRLLRQKDEFIAQLGHDLRTPLTPIIGLLPYIRQRETDPELADLLGILIEDAEQLKDLVEKVLALARLDRISRSGGTDDLVLSREVDRAIAIYRYLVDRSGVTVVNEIPEDLRMVGDRELLRSIVDNLFTNALKYTPPGGSVTLTGQLMGDEVTLSVSDTGVGIEPDAIERIFDEFYTVDPSRTRGDSHGLGLAIVRRLVRQLGGSVQAESPGRGQGSTFRVTLPAHWGPG